MTITEGADADALDRLAVQIEQGATHIEGVYVPVRHSFHASSWQGPDADAFASDWDGPSKARLVQTASALRDAAKILRRNAQEQRTASATDGGGIASILGRLDRFNILRPMIGPSDILNLGDRGLTPGLPPFLKGGEEWFGGRVRDLLGADASGNASLTFGAGGLVAAASGLAFAGLSRSTGGSADFGPLHLTGNAKGTVGASAGGGASATFGPKGADASAHAEGFVGAKGEVSGSANVGPLEAQAQGSAMVGAEANADVSAHLGLDGVSAAASGGGFAGAAAQGSVTAGISGGTVRASGGVEAGVGLSGEAKVSAGWHNTEIKLGGNAALGLGIKGSIDVHVDPSHIASDVSNVAEGAYHAADHLLASLPHPHW